MKEMGKNNLVKAINKNVNGRDMILNFVKEEKRADIAMQILDFTRKKLL